MGLRVGSTIVTPVVCSTPRTDRSVFNTYVGKSNWADAYFQGRIAGLYAVDTLLSEAEIMEVIDSIYTGDDGLQTCATCPASAQSPQGSTTAAECTCLAGSYKSETPEESSNRALVVVPGRAQLSTLAGRNIDLVRAKTGVDGWRLVRFLPAASPGWYSGNDNLAGIAPRGTAYDNNSEWSIPFGEFDEFCFSTRNFLHWLYCSRDAAIGSLYGTNSERDIIRSSISPTTSYTAKWEYRTGNPEDPWIGLRNHGLGPTNTATGDRILYGENSFSSGHWSLPVIASDGGMCVWVRSSANKPVETPTGGPESMGAITFDRELSQFLDSGPRQFNLATNGGFTAVAVVKFTGVAGAHERIFDFGNGPSADNIIIYRQESTSNLNFGIWNGNTAWCIVNMLSVIVQDRWLTIVAVYTSSTRRLELRVGSATDFTTCATTQADRAVSNTFVGKSNFGIGDAFLQGSIAGLHTVDAVLSEAEISSIIGKIYMSDDTLQTCQTCPANTMSLQGSAPAIGCGCRGVQIRFNTRLQSFDADTSTFTAVHSGKSRPCSGHQYSRV